MFNFILLWVVIASFVALFVTISLRVISIRQGKTFDFERLHSYNFIQNLIDYFAYRLVDFTKKIWRQGSLLAMLLVHRLLDWAKAQTAKLERRFARLVDTVHGRGVVASAKKGSVSLFLQEIEMTKPGQKSEAFSLARAMRE